MLFFATDNNLFSDEIELPSVIFTFFFTKIQDGTADTKTQPLINETSLIRNKYFKESFNSKIIGNRIKREDITK